MFVRVREIGKQGSIHRYIRLTLMSDFCYIPDYLTEYKLWERSSPKSSCVTTTVSLCPTTHSWTTNPILPRPVRCVCVTEFWSIECGRKSCTPLPGLAHRPSPPNLHSFSLSPSASWMLTPRTTWGSYTLKMVDCPRSQVSKWCTEYSPSPAPVEILRARN